MLTKRFDAKIHAEPGTKTVHARISTIAVDRDGDVMLPSGVDLKDFKRNPVVLRMHDPKKWPLGKAVRFQQEPDALMATVKFADRPATHPDAAEWEPDTVHSLFQQGVLNAFSVGFNIDDAKEPDRRDRKRFGEACRRIIRKWTLLEFSVVPIPCNQDALAMAVSKGLVRSDSPVVQAIEECGYTGKTAVPLDCRFELIMPAAFEIRV